MDSSSQRKVLRYVAMPGELAADPELGPAAKLVWAILRARTGRSSKCWPSVTTIGSDAGISPATAKRALAELRTAGLVSWESRGDGRTCEYRLVDPGHSDPGQNDLGQNDPGQNGLQTGVKMTQGVGQNDPHKKHKGSNKREDNTPHTPPAGGRNGSGNGNGFSRHADFRTNDRYRALQRARH